MARVRAVALTALFCLATVIAAQKQPPAVPLAAQEEPPAVSLACLGPIPQKNAFLLRFEGEARLPEKTILEISLVHFIERWENGRLVARNVDAGGFMARVENGRFSGKRPVQAPGVYACKVDLYDENQNAQVERLTRDLPCKTWPFRFHAFGDELLGQLEAKLGILDELAGESLAILKEFQEVSVKEEAWKTLEPHLEPRIKKLRSKAEVHDVRDYYRAAMTEIHSTIEVVHQNLRYIVFKDGKFAGAKDYHAYDNQVKTHQGDPYAHENFQRYLQQAPAIAGRELCLWVIKDFRRSGNTLRQETAELVKRVSKRAGVAEFAERLAALTAEKADALEKDVRAAKLP